MFKYLGAYINKDGLRNLSDTVNNSEFQNGTDYDLNILKGKKWYNKYLVETVLCYGSEVWTLNM